MFLSFSIPQIAVAESSSGELQFSLAVLDQLNGATNVAVVLDKNGNLMPGQVGLSRLDVFAQANSKSAIVQDKDNNNLYYIYTLGTNSKLYRHQVSMSAPGNGTADAPLGDVVATNELLVSEADFVPAMAWAHVRTGTAKDLLYMLRSTSNTPDNLQLEAYDITSSTPARTLLASLPGNTDAGEIRLSPNGQYMAVAVNRGLQTGFFDFTSQGSEIRVYHVGTDYQSVSLVNTIQTGTNANALSFDFGPDSRYIYYVSASQANGYQVNRVVTSTSSMENIASAGKPASIARAKNGRLYVAAADTDALTEIDHTPAGAASLRNVPVNADGYQLSGILPLQPHTIAPEGGVQMIFGRKLDAKSYELKDHLGNVRAVVSDRKLSDLSGTSIPYTLTNFHPGILASSNYYPFGMEMPGRNYNAPDYRYGFNGMEKDDEVNGTGNWYTFGDYGYDARIVQRPSPDPQWRKYPSQSSYATFNGNPILYADPTGQSGIVTIDKASKTITVSSIYCFYGSQSSPQIAKQYAENIEKSFNDAHGIIDIDGESYNVKFSVLGVDLSKLKENEIKKVIDKETDVSVNYIRLEKRGEDEASFTDQSGANAGYWNVDQINETKGTTVPHEYNHGLDGLDHPEDKCYQKANVQ